MCDFTAWVYFLVREVFVPVKEVYQRVSFCGTRCPEMEIKAKGK